MNKLPSFEDIKIFIFLLLGLELPTHAPFLRVFGNLTHKCGRPSCRPQSGTSLRYSASFEPTGHYSIGESRGKIKMKIKKRPYISCIWLDAPLRPICTNFGLRVCLVDVIVGSIC